MEDRDSVLGFGGKRVEIGDERQGEMSIRWAGKIGEGDTRGGEIFEIL